MIWPRLVASHGPASGTVPEAETLHFIFKLMVGMSE